MKTVFMMMLVVVWLLISVSGCVTTLVENVDPVNQNILKIDADDISSGEISLLIFGLTNSEYRISCWKIMDKVLVRNKEVFERKHLDQMMEKRLSFEFQHYTDKAEFYRLMLRLMESRVDLVSKSDIEQLRFEMDSLIVQMEVPLEDGTYETKGMLRYGDDLIWLVLYDFFEEEE